MAYDELEDFATPVIRRKNFDDDMYDNEKYNEEESDTDDDKDLEMSYNYNDEYFY